MSTSEKAQNDLKKLKAKYNSQLSTLKELFTEWTEEDLLFTLQDADGDLELAIDRISEGHANQWGEVKTKKSKKEAAAAAAAANKVSLESSTSNTSSTTAPSYPNSFNNRSTTFNSRPSVHQKSHQRSTTAPRQKPISSTANNSVSWQTKKPSTSDFNGDSWNTTTTDSWGSGEDAWKPKEINSNSNNENTSSNAWLETPKKVTSTSSPSTKSSNTGGAKTWASLLQTKEEPVKEAEPVKEIEHKLQKVDNAWLTPATNNATESLSQWDQPIQLPVKEKEEKPQQSIVEEKAEDLAVNFDSLNLEENVPKSNNNASSSHPSVADILNSVQQQQQQPSASNTNTTTTSTTTINKSNTNDVATKQNQTIPEHTEPQSTQNVQQQALYQQQYQQQFQQPQYQQFGIQDYNNSFNANYGAYGNNDRSAYYNAQPQKFAANNKQDGGNKSEGQGQESQFPQMYNNTMQQQQSFYPYYYMPNQFNAYSPYGQHQQVANAFMNGRNNMYPTSVYGQQQSKTPTSSTNATTSATTSAAISSPYGNSSPYNPSQQLYGGFNTTSQFDDFSSSQFYGQPQFLNSQQPQQQQQEGGSPEKTNKSPHNIQQQAYGNNYFGQSPMFSYQQQQQYRSSSSSQQYWNQ